MIDEIRSWFLKQWKDPVWSKVIAAAIIALFGTPLWALYQTAVQDMTFGEALYELWTLNLPLWAVLLIVLFLIWLPLSRKKPATTKSPVSNTNDPHDNTRILYDGIAPNLQDFETDPERDWDSVNQKRIGIRAEGEFSIKDNIIMIKRNNPDGQYQIRLVKYIIEGVVSHVISKDLSRDGRRRLRIMGSIKNSGNGSQNVVFVLRDENGLKWLDSRTETVKSENWQHINFVLHGSFSKDVIIRIDSTKVTSPPNSIYIKDLKVLEHL
jgi:hypothetical protein